MTVTETKAREVTCLDTRQQLTTSYLPKEVAGAFLLPFSP